MADLLDLRCQPWNGTSQSTITLPLLAGNKGQMWIVPNFGTTNVIVSASGADNIWTNQAGTQTYVTQGGGWAIFIDVGTYWLVINGTNGGQTTQEQFIKLTSAYTLVSQTAVQKLFNAPASGQVTLLPGLYFFRCQFALASMSATSGSFGFALGGTAVYTRQSWDALASKGTALATAATPQQTHNTGANTSLATASTGTVGIARIEGDFVVGTAGTCIPQVSLTIAAAAVVQNDSWFRCDISSGVGSTQSVGIWS